MTGTESQLPNKDSAGSEGPACDGHLGVKADRSDPPHIDTQGAVGAPPSGLRWRHCPHGVYLPHDHCLVCDPDAILKENKRYMVQENEPDQQR
jgi:hypothetical protein